MTVHVVDKGWDAFIRKTLACDEKYSKVGYPVGAAPGVGKGGKARTMDEIIDIASTHEFGAPKANIPMRAHVRVTFDEDHEKLQARIFKEIVLILDGKSTPSISLKRLGMWHASRIQTKIKTGNFAPLSKATKDRKHSDKPLIDKAQMIQSVTNMEN